MNKIIRFFDKLEDKVRIKISNYPIIFSLIGGVAIVEFWRGIWQITDYLLLAWFGLPYDGVWSNVISIVVGTFILLITGLYVPLFISDSLIISGIKKERKEFEVEMENMKKEENVIENQVREIKETGKNICDVNDDINALRKELSEIKDLLKKHVV